MPARLSDEPTVGGTRRTASNVDFFDSGGGRGISLPRRSSPRQGCADSLTSDSFFTGEQTKRSNTRPTRYFVIVQSNELQLPRISKLPKAVIFDVDGTLCDVSGVRYHVERPAGSINFKRDFDRFHAESIECPAHPDVLALLNRARAEGYAVVIVTGREEKWSFLTSTWLKDNGVAYEELLMRSAKDSRPDAVVKTEIARDISTRFEPCLAIDDRPDIIEVWHKAGIVTMLVSPTGTIGPPRWPSDAASRVDLRSLTAL